MHFDRRAVQAHVFPADGQDLLFLQPREDPVQYPRFTPAIHPRVDGMPVAKLFRQAAPFAAMLHHVKQSIEQLEIAHADIASLPRQTIGNLFILSSGKLHFHHFAQNSQRVQVVLTGPSRITKEYPAHRARPGSRECRSQRAGKR
jgi:oxalate decarboxylase/phosphoglucose isomerase-like protein (cupin superfamily)